MFRSEQVFRSYLVNEDRIGVNIRVFNHVLYRVWIMAFPSCPVHWVLLEQGIVISIGLVSVTFQTGPDRVVLFVDNGQISRYWYMWQRTF